ncbi:hypothetical protein [Actinoplanes sp. NPDC049265]|uniref:hypothetical protein n=1 Tax=Actinoplanes sp. NPDC049265 TaxID=3363902 RepID=UPI003710BF77
MPDMDMFPELLNPLLATLRAAGVKLGDDWDASQTEIKGYEDGIGAGPIGLAFNGVYRPDADAAIRDANAVPVTFTNNAAVGEKAVADYLEGEARAHAGFRFDDTPDRGI